MSGAARVITEPLGGSRLSAALQAGQLPAELLQPWPRSSKEWRSHIERVRGASNGWLDRIGPALAAGGSAKDRLARAAGGGVVVTTGQQPGLFGGPVYTLSKGLTALAIADAIESELGIPAAPIFWSANDDADFLEASVIHVADAGGLHKLVAGTPPPLGTPLYLAPLQGMEQMLERLRSACGSAAHAKYFELARESFQSERTFGNAYTMLLRRLFEPLGIAVLDASDASYREAARPYLRDALHRAPEIADALAGAARAVRRAGFDPQVEDDRGLSLVFSIAGGIRRRVSLDEARKAAAADDPLAPNVLLRPIVERAILPTAVYAAGPAELAYFIQSNAVAGVLGLDPVVGAPRWSATVIEPFATRALERLGVEYHELRDRHAVERRLAKQGMPPDVARAWQRLKQQLGEAVGELAEAVAESALTPPAVIEGLERSLGHRLSRAERRLLAAVKRRDERVARDIDVAAGALFPLGQRQERILSFIPMLARGGDDLLATMRREASRHAASLLFAGAARPVVTR